MTILSCEAILTCNILLYVMFFWLTVKQNRVDHNYKTLSNILLTSCQVIKMLVTIVVLFSLCWLPLQTFNGIYYFYPDFAIATTDRARTFYALSYFACLWLANANSFVNPLIYCFMSENFRVSVLLQGQYFVNIYTWLKLIYTWFICENFGSTVCLLFYANNKRTSTSVIQTPTEPSYTELITKLNQTKDG